MRNPRNRDGSTTRCNICESIYHWASDCPEKRRPEIQRPIRPKGPPQARYHNVYYQQQDNWDPEYDDDDQLSDPDPYQITLFQSDYDHPKHLPGLVAESWNSAVLDSGATKTVCGRNWYNTFIESLSDEDVAQVEPSPVRNAYRFGDGNKVIAAETVTIPVVLGNKKVGISTDIVEKDIPLLMSREAMKKQV